MRFSGPPFPPFNLLLVGNEENGEGDPFGTPSCPQDSREGEWLAAWVDGCRRTYRRGGRGALRIDLHREPRRSADGDHGPGACGHTGTGGGPRDLLDSLIEMKSRPGLVVQPPPHPGQHRTAGRRRPVSLISMSASPGSTTSPPATGCSESRSVRFRVTTSRLWWRR